MGSNYSEMSMPTTTKKFGRFKLFVYGLKSDASKSLEACGSCTVESVDRVEHIQERGYWLNRGYTTGRVKLIPKLR